MSYDIRYYKNEKIIKDKIFEWTKKNMMMIMRNGKKGISTFVNLRKEGTWHIILRYENEKRLFNDEKQKKEIKMEKKIFYVQNFSHHDNGKHA